MKKPFYVFMMIFAVSIFAQDSTKVSNEALKQISFQNNKLKEVLANKYLQSTGKDVNEAFIDLYIQCYDMEQVVMAAEMFAKDIMQVETIEQLDSLKVKYGL